MQHPPNGASAPTLLWAAELARRDLRRRLGGQSSGLISRAASFGANGLAQCSELSWQLRRHADARLVDGPKVALQHDLALGGAAVVAIHEAPPTP